MFWAKQCGQYGPIFAILSYLSCNTSFPTHLTLPLSHLSHLSHTFHTQACTLIASSTLIGQLYQLWEEKGDDTELLLQLIHCFHK